MAERGLDARTVLAWPLRMTEELLTLPDTLGDLRRLVTELANVATLLGTVALNVEKTVQAINPPLDHTMAQVDKIESAVTELRTALFAVVKRVPGARRTIFDAVPSADPDRRP
jgi:ABC-type transporter Mla subunit MlaD